VKDLFALLGVPRRPWLEANSLKERFLSLSGSCHPDRIHTAPEADKRAAQERFTELNAAYQSLLDPRDRLLHLAELELGKGKGTADIQGIPSDLMTLFAAVGKVCREADVVLAQKNAETSPLLLVQMFERAQNKIEELRAVQQQVARSREGLLSEIRKLDGGWDAMPADERQSRLVRLQEIAGLMNYSKKWNAQIEEKIVRLSF
jgi:curved DNA-binding protein CbpA